MADSNLEFDQLVRSEVKQDCIHYFLAHSSRDGEHIILTGSKTELVTMEMTTNMGSQVPFPFVYATYDTTNSERPLDKITKAVNLTKIYLSCSVMEVQVLCLEPAYMALASAEDMVPREVCASWANKLMPNGKQLMAVLNSLGGITLVNKVPESTSWKCFESLDVSNTIIDTILQPWSGEAEKLATFAQYKEYVDLRWITALLWNSEDDKPGHQLLLGSAAGELFLLNLDAYAKTLLSYKRSKTNLGRISYMCTCNNLLLVSGFNGLVQLFTINDDDESAGIQLKLQLWSDVDAMGLQQIMIQYSPESRSYNVVGCKGVFLVVWRLMTSLENKNDISMQMERIYIGGMKLTGLCQLTDFDSFAVTNARGEIFYIIIKPDENKFRVIYRPMIYDEGEDYQVVGIANSRHNNLMTVFRCSKEEHLLSTAIVKSTVTVRVGKILHVAHEDAYNMFKHMPKIDKPMNHYLDILVDIKLNIVMGTEQKCFSDYLKVYPPDSSGMLSKRKLYRLQLNHWILETWMEIQRNSLKFKSKLTDIQNKMQYMFLLLNLIHIHNRLHYLSTLHSLTEFQSKVKDSWFCESRRIRKKLTLMSANESSYPHIHDWIMKMDTKFTQLTLKLNENDPHPPDIVLPLRCQISYLELEVDMEQRYCSICSRRVLTDESKLMQLYKTDAVLDCPVCRGLYKSENFTFSI